MNTRTLIEKIKDTLDIPSNAELGRRIGARPQHIYQWVEKDVIPPARLIDIHIELGIPIAELVGREPADRVSLCDTGGE